MFPNEFIRQRIKLSFGIAIGSIVPSIKLAAIQKDNDQKVEGAEGDLFNRKPSVAICSVATLDRGQYLIVAASSHVTLGTKRVFA